MPQPRGPQQWKGETVYNLLPRALQWLKEHIPFYSDVHIQLPGKEDGQS